MRNWLAGAILLLFPIPAGATNYMTGDMFGCVSPEGFNQALVALDAHDMASISGIEGCRRTTPHEKADVIYWYKLPNGRLAVYVRVFGYSGSFDIWTVAANVLPAPY